MPSLSYSSFERILFTPACNTYDKLQWANFRDYLRLFSQQRKNQQSATQGNSLHFYRNYFNYQWRAHRQILF